MRRLALVAAAFVLALAGRSGAETLAELCIKGGITVTGIGLTRAQAKQGFDDNCAAYKVGFPPEEQLSSTVGSEAWNSRDLKSRPH